MNTKMPDELARRVMDLVDLLGRWPEETKLIDPRAWEHLRVYMPRDAYAEKLRTALAELVRLKDLKDEYERLRSQGFVGGLQMTCLMTHYEHGKTPAWREARAALAENPKILGIKPDNAQSNEQSADVHQPDTEPPKPDRCLQPDAMDSACKCCQRWFRWDAVRTCDHDWLLPNAVYGAKQCAKCGVRQRESERNEIDPFKQWFDAWAARQEHRYIYTDFFTYRQLEAAFNGGKLSST